MSYLNVPSFSKYLIVLYFFEHLDHKYLKLCGGLLYYVAAMDWVLAT